MIDINDLKERGRPYLQEYLTEKGIEFNKNGLFSCIHPDHDDSNPSCGIIPASNGEEFHCLGCLDENEHIWTEKGLVPIGKIEVGDKVYSIDGTLKKVLAREDKERTDILKISTGAYRDPLILTSDHTMVVLEFEDLKKEVPFIFNNSSRPYGIGWKGIYKKPKNISVPFVEKRADEVSPYDFIAFPVCNIVGKVTSIINTYKWKGKGPKPVVIKQLNQSPEIARMLGLYMAEGNTGRGYIEFTFNIDETYTLADDVVLALKNIGLESTKFLKPERNTCTVMCGNTSLSHMFQEKFGAGAWDKKIPEEIFTWDLEHKLEFLNGYLDGDGSSKLTKKNRVYNTSVTTSKKMINGLFRLCVDCLLLPSVSYSSAYTDKDGTYHRESWILTIKTREGLSGFYQEIDNTIYYISQVEAVEEITDGDTRRIVVDISVEGNETFLTKLGVVHNCQRSGDIYTAAHYLEGKPLYGPGFLTENLSYILDKYEIEHEKIELSEQQILDIKYTKVYNAAVALMFSKNTLGSYSFIDFSHARTRGWAEDTAISLGIGTILNFDAFISALAVKTDLSKDQLIDMGIDSKLFGPTKLTFCIKDHKDKVRGFVCRNMDFKKDGDIEKYCNTSEYKNPFYQKDKLLYGLNIASKYTGLRLDIFEGYGSYVTAYQAGYRTCVAMGGTAFTADHAQLLYELGFRHINYVMDVDDTGTRLSKVYIERFSGFQGLKVTITKLPIPTEDIEKDKGNNDADYYIKTYGIDAYRKIKTIGAFEHSLEKIGDLVKESEEAISFAKETIKLLMNEENRIERGRMIKILSDKTGVSKDDLEAEIYRIQGSQANSIKNKLEKKLKNTNDPDTLEQLLSTSLSELKEGSNTKEDKYLISTAESVEVWSGIFSDMNAQKSGIHGWKTGYQILDDKLDGLAKPNRGGVAIGLAGAPQHAKSAMLLNIVTQAILNNNEDLSVLYWAIDDNRKTIGYRLVAMLSGVHIKKVRNMLPRSPEEDEAIKAAQRLLIKWTEEKKLIIKDDLFGRSKNKAEHWISSFQNESNNQILFCIDSLNNIAGDDGAEMRSKMISSSGWAKSLTTRIPCTVLATMELVKNRTDEKPNLMSIAESGKLEYDFDAIAVVWNESQGKYGNIQHCNAKWGTEGFWKPVIELDFQKNKCAAGEKGSIFFDFDPSTTRLLNARSELIVQTAPIEIKTKSGSFKIRSEFDVNEEAPPKVKLNV